MFYSIPLSKEDVDVVSTESSFKVVSSIPDSAEEGLDFPSEGD